MLAGLTTLVVFQLAGELMRLALGLPVPGPIIGMGLLLAWLCRRRTPPPDDLARTADALLRHLPLLFVPATAGVTLHLALLREQWAAMLAAVVGGTLATIVLTAMVAAAADRVAARRRAPSRKADVKELAE